MLGAVPPALGGEGAASVPDPPCPLARCLPDFSACSSHPESPQVAVIGRGHEASRVSEQAGKTEGAGKAWDDAEPGQAGRREGSRSRRHPSNAPASFGLFWGPGRGLTANVLWQQVFPDLFFTAEVEGRPPPDIIRYLWAARARDTTCSPWGPALSCDERIAANTHSQWRQAEPL